MNPRLKPKARRGATLKDTPWLFPLGSINLQIHKLAWNISSRGTEIYGLGLEESRLI